ncbi:MAG: ribonuclease BN (tRNA processing enzyme) [Verrucomicrobiales bacterium]|jgi:ribonuclease BN (tRNA processing enzyme)
MTTENPNDLRVTVIGCSGTYSSADSSCSSYLVQTDSTSVVLDTGPGSSIELQRHLDLADVDAIILSHEHPDHWTEMPSLYHAYRFGLGRPHVPVYGTAGTRLLLDAACSEATAYTFDWITIDASSAVTIGDIDFTFSKTDHPVETLAIRAESGNASIAYSADTGPDWSPEGFESPIDLMVYEASLRVEMEDLGIPHVSGRHVGINAAAAGIRHLVLTHLPPGEDPDERAAAAAASFSGPIDIAAPGRTFRA